MEGDDDWGALEKTGKKELKKIKKGKRKNDEGCLILVFMFIDSETSSTEDAPLKVTKAKAKGQKKGSDKDKVIWTFPHCV
jgi:hypothetical protein